MKPAQARSSCDVLQEDTIVYASFTLDAASVPHAPVGGAVANDQFIYGLYAEDFAVDNSSVATNIEPLFKEDGLMRGIMALALLALLTGSLIAQVGGEATLQVREDDGGSVAVRTASGILNQGSSLRRRWLGVDDLSSPVRLNRSGVFTRFDEKEQTPFLVPIGTVSPKQAISAVEVRYLLFDVWGQQLRTLSVTRLADSSTNVDLREETAWPALDHEAAQLVTVVAFVARVRTAEGQVWSFDPERMLGQVQALGLSATPPDLTSDERRPIDPRAIYWTYDPTGKRSAVNSAVETRP